MPAANCFESEAEAAPFEDLGGAGDWAHEIDAVDGGGHAEERRRFAGDGGRAQGSGAGANEDGAAAFFFGGQSEGQLEARTLFEGHVGMKIDAGARDIPQLAGVKFDGTLLGHADLDGQVDFVPARLATFGHDEPPGRYSSVRCNRVAKGTVLLIY